MVVTGFRVTTSVSPEESFFTQQVEPFRRPNLKKKQRCFSGNLPSLKLTWHLKITPWRRRFLLKTIIFRGVNAVNFREGMVGFNFCYVLSSHTVDDSFQLRRVEAPGMYLDNWVVV